MLATRLRGALCLVSSLTLAGIAACGGGGSDVTGNNGGNGTTPASIAAFAGNGQVGFIGTALPSPLVVKVTTSSGAAVQNAVVNFAVTSGAASVSPTTATTDTAGTAKTNVTLGSSSGTVVVTATVAGTALSTTFTVTAGTTTQSTACSTSSPQTLSAGGVLPLSSGTGVCLTGGTAGSEYALVAFYANPDSSQVTSVTVKSSGGATAVSTPDVTPSFSETVANNGLTLHPSRVNRAQYAFDTRLRRMAQQVLAPKVLGPHPQITRSNAVTVPANPTVCTLYTLNANGNDPCTNAINVTARVAAVGNTNIILADTANPKAGGFTDAQYASFATEFDTLINPLDVQNFGQPSDIDKNGKVLILFTKEVNKLTPRNSNGVIDGFFFERDLFPTSDTNLLQGCPTSNFAEMFYVVVPDTAGVFSDRRSQQDVLTGTPGTLAHEYQHLINAGRRLYVNSFQGFFEDVWLNEGLSHIAEELLFYKESGLSPRQNIGITQLRASTTALNAFNNEQIENSGRYEVFLSKPNQTSVYAGNDSLEVRGAIWSLLRYLADQRAGTSNDADTWSRLVNTESHGQANIAAVFGSDYMTQIRNWATSVFSDDVPGVTDARYLQPSWNYRSLFPNFVNSSGTRLGIYPLTVIPLSDANPQTVSIDAGGEAYYRFFVPAGTNVSIDWSSGGLPVSGLLQFTVVRSK